MARRRGPCRHCLMMDAFYTAREMWEDAAEAFSRGYATELALFKQDNPRPRLVDFMRGTY